MAGGRERGLSADDVAVGCRVHVLPGRKFDSFGSGQTGEVTSVFADAGNCDVLFEGREAPVRVALRHLRLAAGDGRALEEVGDGGCSAKSAASCPPASAASTTAGPTGDCELAAQRCPVAVDSLMSYQDVSGDPLSYLGPIAAAYDGVYKWKGCALASDGCLYCAPYGSSTVLVIDPNEQKLFHIEGAGREEYKWSGIAAGVDGLLYCAPCHASTVLVIDPLKRSLRHLEGAGSGEYKWSGITAASDGLLYCAPARATTVLVIDPVAQTLSHISGAGGGSSKWSGIAEGPDGCLYCAPSMATAVLVVDLARRSLSRMEGALDGSSFKYKWSGVARGSDGLLYCAPYNATCVLVIDPLARTLDFLGDAGAGECKWSGIAPGLDRRLYCVPSRATSVLVIEPGQDDLAYLEQAVAKGNAKWSGLCVGLDRRLYCVPYNSTWVLSLAGLGGVSSRPPRQRREREDIGLVAGSCGGPYAAEEEELRREFAELLASPPGERAQRYRALCRRWHPDKRPEDPAKATAMFQFLQQLHERFSDSC